MRLFSFDALVVDVLVLLRRFVCFLIDYCAQYRAVHVPFQALKKKIKKFLFFN